jgi:chorismate dehydratase
VLCARHFRIDPSFKELGPDLASMLDECDAALLIGDNALFANPELPAGSRSAESAASEGSRLTTGSRRPSTIRKIDLGDVWTTMTGLPFVWAFWAGRAGALAPDDVAALRHARDLGVTEEERIAQNYFPDSVERQRIGARYLRDNIKYGLGADERAGLELFYRYAAEAGAIEATSAMRFYEDDSATKTPGHEA